MAANYLGGPYKLRVLKPDAGGNFYRRGAVRQPVWPTPDPQTIATSLPISAGDLIGLEVPSVNGVPFRKIPGSFGAFMWDFLPLNEGDLWAPNVVEEDEREYGFNAEVQPPPTLGSIAPSAGSVSGRETISMTGTDLDGTTAVMFGEIPALNFTVTSGTQLRVVVPPSARVSSVDVSIKTAAGTSSLPSAFSYEGCIVPNVKGMKLKAARGTIRAANCTVGILRKTKSRRKVGRVISQLPVAGTIRLPGSQVSPVLGARHLSK